MSKKKKKIFTSVLLLGAGTFIAKLLGAIYRIPLTAILTSTGLGLYQMVFPVYTVLLDFSGAGVPSALSKLISGFHQDSGFENARKYLSVSLKVLAVFGLAGFIIMAGFAKPFSVGQGNGDAYLGYLFLSPSVLLVSLISCFRGYFQGLMKMHPTAISQVIEQAVKLIFGLLFSYLLLPDVKKAVAGATFAITLSEAFALLILYVTYRRHKKFLPQITPITRKEFLGIAKEIIRTTIPITLIGIIIPLSQVADSFLTLNIIGSYREDATSLYGILSGVVLTVIHLPVAVCYGISTVAIPAVSGSKNKADKNKNAGKTMVLTFIFAVAGMLACILFAPFIIKILFSSLQGAEYTLAVELLKITSPVILFLSLLQTVNGVFIGMGKPVFPIISLIFGVSVKIVLNFILLKNPALNIYGGAIALIACYFSACLINLIILFIIKVKDDSKEYKYRRLTT